MIVASNAAGGTSNKALIKKVIGLVVVVAVCVVVVVVVLNVLKTFGDSDDDSQEERKFEGESLQKRKSTKVNYLFTANVRSNCLTTNTSELFLYHQSSRPLGAKERATLGTSSLLMFLSALAHQNSDSNVPHMIDNKAVHDHLEQFPSLTEKN